MRKPIPNYYSSLQDYKDSMKESPSPTYPEGFTPYPEGFTPYPKGFTPGASVPKSSGRSKPMSTKSKMNEDPNNVRKMQDRLKVVVKQFDELNNDMKASDKSALAKMGSEIDKLQRGIVRTKKKK